jgi:hypothetical protein
MLTGSGFLPTKCGKWGAKYEENIQDTRDKAQEKQDAKT